MNTNADRTSEPAPRRRPSDWESEFPYAWDRDDLVSRRQLLRFAVMASGVLFAATGILAGLGLVRSRSRGTRQAIIESASVPPGQVHYFNYPGTDDEALLLHLQGGTFVAYSGKCTHLSCAVYWNARQGRLLCPCHDGEFSPQNGDVVAGPPTRPLPRILLEEVGGVLYALKEVPE